MPAGTRRLLELARRAPDLGSWRQSALAVLATRIGFDRAIFHDLSPRAPLSRGAFIGIDPGVVATDVRRWDEHAVVLGRLRDLALAHGGVATDAQAFPSGTRARREWHARVGRPLGLSVAMLAHLVLQNRVVSVVLLGRRRGPPFTSPEIATLARLVPALAVGDALHQSLESRVLSGPAARLECVDQRLTPRQREVVVHVALGHTNAEIGEALGISANTVRNLLVQTRARLGAANRAEVVRVAVLR